MKKNCLLKLCFNVLAKYEVAKGLYNNKRCTRVQFKESVECVNLNRLCNCTYNINRYILHRREKRLSFERISRLVIICTTHQLVLGKQLQEGNQRHERIAYKDTIIVSFNQFLFRNNNWKISRKF